VLLVPVEKAFDQVIQALRQQSEKQGMFVEGFILQQEAIL
jgi:uncharacterized protein (DUF302 family)